MSLASIRVLGMQCPLECCDAVDVVLLHLKPKRGSLMALPDSILHLGETFIRHRQQYKAPGYNETQLRREFP